MIFTNEKQCQILLDNTGIEKKSSFLLNKFQKVNEKSVKYSM